MEKSIETIWKEGFLDKNALVAPKLNNLYNQKSKHIIDQYRRMFKTNLVAIFAGSFVVLLLSFLVGMSTMGILMFILFNVIVIVNRNLLRQLDKIEISDTSYQYLKQFDAWMDRKAKINTRMHSIIYPYAFFAMIVGLWMINIDGVTLGETLVDAFTAYFPGTVLWFGIPLFGIIGLAMILVILAFLGERMYKRELNLIYGRVIGKLKDLIADMEELRS